jgi:RimJ/RimL family protein N-acetyltransferase
LLAEKHWGKGLASEFLRGFIQEAVRSKALEKLVGGVDRSNIASAKLLQKLGFEARADDGSDVIFYAYVLPQTES